jgi:predicted kinase
VVLDLPLDDLWERLSARNTIASSGSFSITRAELESFDALYQRPTADELARYGHHILH